MVTVFQSSNRRKWRIEQTAGLNERNWGDQKVME